MATTTIQYRQSIDGISSEEQAFCDCCRFLRTLEPDESLPDHVHLETIVYAANLRFATNDIPQATQTLFKMYWWGADAPAGMNTAIAGNRQSPPNGQLPPAVEQVLLDLACHEPFRGTQYRLFNLPHVALEFQIRQWVYGERSSTVANKLAHWDRWQRVVRFNQNWNAKISPSQVEAYDVEVQEAKRTRGAIVAAHVEQRIWQRMCSQIVLPPEDDAYWRQYGQTNGYGGLEHLYKDLFFFDGWVTDHDDGERMKLHRLGFPPTLPTWACLLSTIRGTHPTALPAAGLLVTTKIRLYKIAARTDALFFNNNPDLTLSYAPEFTPPSLVTQGDRVGRAHRDWFRRYGQSPITTLSATRRAQSTSFAHSQPERHGAETEYLASGLNPAQLQLLAAEAVGKDRGYWAAKIKRDTKLVDDRVSKARQKHTPPLPRLPRRLWATKMAERYWQIYEEVNKPKDPSDSRLRHRAGRI